MVRLGREAFTRCSIRVLDAHAKNYIERAWKEGYRTINRVSKPMKHNQCVVCSSNLFKRKFRGDFSVAQLYPSQEGSSRAESFHLAHESRKDGVAKNGQ